MVPSSIKPRYSPFTLLGWQSHPFTLAYWIELDDNTHSSASTSQDNMNEKIPLEVTKTVTSSDHSPTQEWAPSSPRITDGTSRYSLLIRPGRGYTGRLRRSLTKAPEPTPLTFLYEGPYGRVHKLDHFSDILLVIGGSGISVGISYIYNTLKQNNTTRFRLVWACRSKRSYMDSILSKELRFALLTGRLKIDV